MYKLLLSWRYLRTRYIALASIVSVTLGVATLIIVNSVMAGFSDEMQRRLNGILSDIVVEGQGLDGFPDPEWHQEEIRKVVGEDLAGMTASVHVPAFISIPANGQFITKQITLIGIDEATYAEVGDFSQYLLHPENRKQLSFGLHEGNYAEGRAGFPESGWAYRRARAAYEKALEQMRAREAAAAQRASGVPLPGGWDSQTANPGDASLADESGIPAPAPFATPEPAERRFDPAVQQATGVILGIAICSQRYRDSEGEVQDYYYCRPGDDVTITFPRAGSPPRPADDVFTVVDFYESKMSEYDANFAFVPLRRLQELRRMIDINTGVASVTSIRLKLRSGADLNEVRDKLRARFPVDQFPLRIHTWMDLQGPLLAAVNLETTILNILLFLIIAVAGFGILATFFMIVVEKTRDIGILKSLGAPSRGVMSIFLSYGLSLGIVGAGVGMVLGLIFVQNINAIARLIETATGREVFDPTVYYFQEIPTIINPGTVLAVAVGAVIIAVLASVLPARRAARLHPVEALRYE